MDLKITQRERYQFFCPLCGNHEKTRTVKPVAIRQHLQIALATFVFSYFLWPVFGPKGVLTYLVFWAGTEFAMRLQRRSQWLCSSCGFDPFLYKQDPEKMRAVVKEFIQKRIDTDAKLANVKFRNYRSQSESNGPDADGKNEKDSEQNSQATPSVGSDFKLLDDPGKIAEVHRTELP